MSMHKDKLNLVFTIANFLDETRWSNKGHYNLINFSRADLTDAQKILIHWISYITDRRTPFRRIWDVGGFVFSDLVYKITNDRNIDYLNPLNPKSFFVPIGKNSKEFTFISRQKVNKNVILLRYNLEEDDRVPFKSRFYPADYKSITATFNILKEKTFNFNFIRYVKFILNSVDRDKHNFIKKLLYGLYLLTYFEIGNISASDLTPYGDFMDKLKKEQLKL